MIADANIIGITPAALTRKGMYWVLFCIIVLPAIFFPYCTGILRVPRVSNIDAATTIKNIPRRIIPTIGSPVSPIFLIVAARACGARTIIPAIIINEMPLPIPRSVIISPIQTRTIVPVVIAITASIIKPIPASSGTTDPPPLVLIVFIQNDNAVDWKTQRSTVP